MCIPYLPTTTKIFTTNIATPIANNNWVLFAADTTAQHHLSACPSPTTTRPLNQQDGTLHGIATKITIPHSA